MKLSLITGLFSILLACTVQDSMAFQKNNDDNHSVGIGNGIVDGNFIGGLNNYDPSSYTIFKSKIGTPTITVSSAEELKDALKKAVSGNIIYVKDDAEIDLSDNPAIIIPSGVTLCSGRGVNKSLGALVFSNSVKTAHMFTVGSNTKIIGLRIKGPDGLILNRAENDKAKVLYMQKNPGKKIDTTYFKDYGQPNSNGIMVVGKSDVIENCEIFNWTYAGVLVRNGARCIIDHNYIHHCQHNGLGYGVNTDKGFAVVIGNLFDYNRHSIAGSGSPGTGYIASYNVALPHATLQGHIFDMHGGGDRKDGTTTAGDSVIINNNLFFINASPAIRVRGIPLFRSSIYDNSFVIIHSLNYNARKFEQASAKKIQMDPLKQILQYHKRTLNIHDNNFYDAN